MVDSVEGLSADDIPDLLPSLPKSQAEGWFHIQFNNIGIVNFLQINDSKKKTFS